MNTRLQQFIVAENITQSQFADTIGVARASVSHILSGRNKPGFDFIENVIKKYPSLNVEWLIAGKGKMYKQDRDTKDPAPATTTSPPIPAASSPLGAVLDLSNNDPQSQRIAKRVIVLFDDGTYQEL